MAREFKHAVTGRSIHARKGSRAERLVEADANWSEVKAEPKRAASTRSKKSKSDDE